MPYNPQAQSDIDKLNQAITFLSGAPDPAGVNSQMLSAYRAKLMGLQNQNQPDPNDYFNPDLINRFFNVSAGNLNRGMGNAVNTAQSNAAALAASRGFLNPSGFIMGAGSQARAPYVSALGGLEGQRAGALQGNQSALFNAILQLLQGNRQFGLQQQQLGLQQRGLSQNEAGAFDYMSAFLPLLGLATGGGSTLLGSLLFPNRK